MNILWEGRSDSVDSQKFEGGAMVRALTFLSALMCMVVASATASPKPKGKYAIVTNLASDDGYYKAVEGLKKIHPKARIFRFEGRNLKTVEKALKEWKPLNVAVVLKPADLDMNFQGEFLQLCTGIDDDPFCDFSYGYVTGATAQEAIAFVKNVAKVWKTKLPQKILKVPTAGGPSTRRVGTALHSFGLKWPQITLSFGEKNGEHMTEEEVCNRLKEHLADFQGNALINMGGHGSPEQIVGNLSGAAIREYKPKLFPAIVYNYACLTGCVDRSFEWMERGQDNTKISARSVDPQKSIALAILASGASAYIASIEPRPSGPGMAAEIQYAMTSGATIGQVRKREYDMLALAFLSWGEEGLVVPRYKEGEKRKFSRNAVRGRMMMMASGAVLFGDPSFRICPKSMDLVKTDLRKNKKEYKLQCTVNVASWSQGYDPYRGYGDRGLASRIYACVDLPDKVKSIRKVDVLSVTTPADGDIDYKHLIWAIEKVDGKRGKRRLHIKINGPSGLLRAMGSQATYRIVPGDGSDPSWGGDITQPEPKKSELLKALDQPWHLKRGEWALGDFLGHIERCLKKWAGSYDYGLAKFSFADDAKDALGKKVIIDAPGKTLRWILDTICRDLGLQYSTDEKTTMVHFSRKKK
jgi:hypothetical protein